MTFLDWIKAGYGFSCGVLLVATVFSAAVLIFGSIFERPYDTTDMPPERSGMVPLTDALTGCQYLKAGSALTPRMGPDGTQICARAG